MEKRFVGLIILDGWGIKNSIAGNAIKLANPHYIDGYFKAFPFTKIEASSVYVGLPKGQIGNSEVGHLNIGAGRVVVQNLQRISGAIKDKSFFSNKSLLDTFNFVNKNSSDLHIMGLTSFGGVHSHINHLFALLKFAKQQKVKRVYIHAFTDGRDNYTNSSITDIGTLLSKLKSYPGYKIASIMGRFYAMDREQNYDRTQKAYNAIVRGESEEYAKDALQAIKKSYNSGIYDEFIKPVVITENDKPVATIKENDGIIFFNFREDRTRQLTASLVEDSFNKFKVNRFKNVKMCTFTRYDKTFKKPIVAFDEEDIGVNLSSVISANGLKQFKVTETTKYPHVTYYLNGGIEVPYEGESRFMCETIKTDSFDKTPAMRAREITEKAIQEIKTKKYAFMALNYSNCDMIGHTGNLNAAVKAVKVLNEEVKKLVDVILSINGIAVITADHGNAEDMINKTGQMVTSHTTNKVPFCIVSNDTKGLKLKKTGMLGNIAPTILQLLGIKKPKEFTLDSLIEN